MRFFMLRHLIVVSMLCVTYAFADGAAALEPVAQTPQQEALSALYESDDAPFEQFVLKANLEAALHWRDAGQLADCALLLAHGERVLLRKHHSGLTPEQLLNLASETAMATRDKQSLERLEQVAGSLDLSDLASKLATAKKTAEPSRGGGKNRLQRVAKAKVSSAMIKKLRSHQIFSQLFYFQSDIVIPRKGVTLYFNPTMKSYTTFSFKARNPPSVIAFDASTPTGVAVDGMFQYFYCSCGGKLIPPDQAPLLQTESSEPSGGEQGSIGGNSSSVANTCQFLLNGLFEVSCGGTCEGSCKMGKVFVQPF